MNPPAWSIILFILMVLCALTALVWLNLDEKDDDES